MADRIAEGGCLCGAVRYRADVAPVALALCHCQSCRRAAGAPSMAWAVFPQDAFVFTQGEASLYESSPGVIRGFCARCGTNLTYQNRARPAVIDVTTASLDRPEDFAPTKEIWIAEKIAWEQLNDAIPHFPQSSLKKSA